MAPLDSHELHDGPLGHAQEQQHGRARVACIVRPCLSHAGLSERVFPVPEGRVGDGGRRASAEDSVSVCPQRAAGWANRRMSGRLGSCTIHQRNPRRGS
jgi:hypothetical protein